MHSNPAPRCNRPGDDDSEPGDDDSEPGDDDSEPGDDDSEPGEESVHLPVAPAVKSGWALPAACLPACHLAAALAVPSPLASAIVCGASRLGRWA